MSDRKKLGNLADSLHEQGVYEDVATAYREMVRGAFGDRKHRKRCMAFPNCGCESLQSCQLVADNVMTPRKVKS